MSEIWLEGFGMLAITIMVTSYALEQRGPRFVLVFALGCALAAIYAALLGSIPFVVAEGVWSLIAFSRWRRLRTARLGSADAV